MKYFFLMTLIAYNTFAGDEKLCDHLKKETFRDHASSFGIFDKKNILKIVSLASEDLSKKVESQCKEGKLWAVKDYDSCSSACLTNGGNDLQKLKINEDTRVCQTFCKSYQLAAFAFEKGQRSKENEGQHKCGAHVNNDESGLHKSDLAEKVKQQVKVQNNASGQ